MYPKYVCYPRWKKAPGWTSEVIATFTALQAAVDTEQGQSFPSNGLLQLLRPGLESLGFQVEAGKKDIEKIYRPVLFGENGVAEREYEIDAYHMDWKVALEVEAGRSWMGNAIYRDVIQMSLLVDVDFAVVAVPAIYRFKAHGKPQINKAYDLSKSVLDAIYSGRRLELPFQGLLLVGY